MNIQISSEHIELLDHHKDYILNKLDVLSKYSEILKMKEEAINIKVMVESRSIKDSTQHIIIKVNMSVPHALIRGEASGQVIEEVVDLVVEKLKRQIDRYKEKHMHNMHNPMQAMPSMQETTPEAVVNEPMYKITRRKLFNDLYPMSEMEAVDTMETLGHTFFIFVNERTDRYNLVYKRSDGQGYGLVELEQREGVIGSND